MVILWPKNWLDHPSIIYFHYPKTINRSKHPFFFNLIMKKEALLPSRAALPRSAGTSDINTSEVFLAEILLRSPRKLFIFIICKNDFRIKVSKKYLI